jgi:hypothetical protein
MRGDDDIDGDANGGYDDELIRAYGHAASDPQRQAITALAKRFYAAAAAGEAARTCAMVAPRVVDRNDLVKAVPDEYIPLGGAAALRGRRCAPMMSRVFAENRARLAAESTTLLVTSVRVKGDRAIALLGFKSFPERYLPLRLEGATWRLGALLDEEIT